MSSCFAASVIAALFALAELTGCTLATRQQVSAPLSPQSLEVLDGASLDTADNAGPMDLTGVWEGTRIDRCDLAFLDNSRCNAVMNLGLTMLQEGNRVSGFYRCSINTVNCLNMNETGVIKAGEMGRRLLTFRVMLEDGSSCIFTSVPQSNRMSGGFICLQGAAIMERGHWQAQRSY